MAPDAAAALSALLRSASLDDHDEILKAANAAIKANKSNQVAQRTRVVALLKLDRFQDAIDAIREGGEKLEAVCHLEKAYSLYKTGQLDEASAVIDSAGSDTRSLKHVAAQVSYRAERFSEAESIYRHLMDAGVAHEGNDLSINIKAAQAQSVWQKSASASFDDAQASLDTFEICYNTACAHIARGSLETASELLARAVDLCRASDDLTQEDQDAELQPILAQQAYVYGRLGDVDKALNVYQSLQSLKNDDPDSFVVAESNRTALLSGKTNPYLVQRRATAWMNGAASAKLFRYQSNAILRNSLLVDLEAHKTDGVEHRTRKMLNSARHSSTSPETTAMSVINVAAQTKGLRKNELRRKVADMLKKSPDSVALVILMIQLLVRDDKIESAMSLLETFFARLEASDNDKDKDIRFSPGLVALAVSLMKAKKREASIKTELTKAATYWRERPLALSASLLREAGLELAKSSDPADLSLAAAALGRLHDEDKASPLVAAGLTAALATTDASQIEQLTATLPPVESLITSIDIDALASAGIVTPASQATTTSKRPAPDAAEGTTKKRRRRTRLPKNMEEGKTPDPERWLPLRDRSSYRPKGKKGKKKAAESTQGGPVKQEETLELVGGGGVKVEKTGGAVSSAKKKKKKGKK
ncbi:hypothetical protein CDD80_3869 [Ophiocordyceps camponoti-rufipedis]|uniref:Signal recognition particle subunit SRP72 n=1 Tax=Ophiocordyceps camponoti-rufipedis TaxID=2004952 RepID=A0A2C5XVP0_9HYPO|nr:hypothetical protein CDD80_3869 [Ophiocordyceps camponoti-rufipedis]